MSRSSHLRHLMATPPRQAGSIVFHGSRRDATRAVASAWVTLYGTSSGRSSNGNTTLVPGTTSLWAYLGPDRVEIDLDSASSGDTRSFFVWVGRIIQSRHFVLVKHLVVVHGAEKAERAALSKLTSAPYSVLVASTTKPDSRAIRLLSGAQMVRVPVAEPLAIPAVAQSTLQRMVTGTSGVLEVREAVHALRCRGFTLDEIAQFAYGVFIPDQPLDATSALLAHMAGTSALDDRATETLVVHMLMRSRAHTQEHVQTSRC